MDAANYVLMDSGHPMHTFDLDTISGNKIIVRYAENGEQFTTLDNEKRDLKDFRKNNSAGFLFSYLYATILQNGQ